MPRSYSRSSSSLFLAYFALFHALFPLIISLVDPVNHQIGRWSIFGGVHGCGSQNWAHKWGLNASSDLTFELSDSDYSGNIAVTGFTNIQHLLQPFADAGSSQAAILLVYDTNTPLPVLPAYTACMTDAGSTAADTIVALSIDPFGSKHVSVIFDSPTYPETLFGVYTPNNGNHFGKIQTYDCYDSINIVMVDDENFWLTWENCQTTAPYDFYIQRIQIINLNNSNNKKFQRMEYYGYTDFPTHLRFTVSRTSAGVTGLHMLSKYSYCTCPGGVSYTNGWYVNSFISQIEYASCLDVHRLGAVFQAYSGSDSNLGGSAYNYWQSFQMISRDITDSNAFWVISKKRIGLSLAQFTPKAGNTHGAKNRFLEIHMTSWSVKSVRLGNGKFNILIEEPGRLILITNFDYSNLSQTIGTASTQIQILSILLTSTSSSANFVASHYDLLTMEQFHINGDPTRPTIYGLSTSVPTVFVQFDTDPSSTQLGNCLVYQAQDFSSNYSLAGNQISTITLAVAGQLPMTSLSSQMNTDSLTAAQSEIISPSSYINQEVCLPDLTVTTSSTASKLKTGLGSFTPTMSFTSTSSCVSNPIDTATEVITTIVGQVVQQGNSLITYLGTVSVSADNRIVLDAVPFTFSQINLTFEITFKVCLVQDTPATCSGQRSDQTLAFEVISCSPYAPLNFPMPGSNLFIDIDSIGTSIANFVDTMSPNSDQCYYKTRLILQANSAKQAAIDGTIFLFQDRTFNFDPLDNDIITVTQQPKFSILPTEYKNEGIYSFTVYISAFDTFTQTPPEATIGIDFSVELSANPCLPNLIAPQISGQTFTYTLLQPALTVPLVASNGQCEFFFELELIQNGGKPDPTNLMFLFEQPTFLQDASYADQRFRVVDEQGSLKIEGDETMIVFDGLHSINLIMRSHRYPDEILHLESAFQVQINACLAMLEQKNHQMNFNYELGMNLINLVVNSIEPKQECYERTSFEVHYINNQQREQNLPNFVQFSQISKSCTLSVNTYNEDDVGLYEFEIIESVEGKNSTSITKLSLQVKVPAPEIVEKEPLPEPIQEEQIEDLETTSTFSFQKIAKKVKKRQNRVVFPLTAKVFDFTQTGNLTVIFSKPIIVPPIFVHSLDQNRTNQTQNDEQSTKSENKRHLKTFKSKLQPIYELKDVLKLDIIASYLDISGDIVPLRVSNYFLTRLEEQVMDIQLSFNDPKKVSQSFQWPDKLNIKFQSGSLFMDSLDFTQIQKDLSLEVNIVPQVSQSEQEILDAVEEAAESTLTVFSISQLIINSFLAMGLKYLWNLVNLLQFVVFMQAWIISLPNEAKAFLKTLKTLALFEFLPTEEILSMFDLVCDKNEIDPCACDKNSSSGTLVSNMGIMLIFGLIGLILLILVLIASIVGQKSQRIQAMVRKLKQKIFYNSFIRYIFQSTLKMQLAAATCILLATNLQHSRQQKEQKNICRQLVEDQNTFVTTPSDIGESMTYTSACLILAFFSFICPYLFKMMLHSRHASLDSQEIKNQIGSLYLGLIPHRLLAKHHSTLFLIRRSFFVLISSLLAPLPGIQIQLMIFGTIQYVQFLHASQVFEDRFQRKLETVNEIILIAICYHFVLLANLTWDFSLRQNIGYSLICVTSLLLIINLTVMISVSIKGCIENVRIKKNREKQKSDFRSRAKIRAQKYQKGTEKVQNLEYEQADQVQDEQESKLMNKIANNAMSQEEQKQKCTFKIELPNILLQKTVDQQLNYQNKKELDRSGMIKETQDALVSSKTSEMTEEDIYDFIDDHSKIRSTILGHQSQQENQIPLKLRQKLPNISQIMNSTRKGIHPKIDTNPLTTSQLLSESKINEKSAISALLTYDRTNLGQNTQIVDYRLVQRKYSNQSELQQSNLGPQKKSLLYQGIYTDDKSRNSQFENQRNSEQTQGSLRPESQAILEKAQSEMEQIERQFVKPRKSVVFKSPERADAQEKQAKHQIKIEQEINEPKSQSILNNPIFDYRKIHEEHSKKYLTLYK